MAIFAHLGLLRYRPTARKTIGCIIRAAHQNVEGVLESRLVDDWYHGAVQQGVLHHDVAQVRACHKLQKLQNVMHNYTNKTVRLWRKHEDYQWLQEILRRQAKEEIESKKNKKKPPDLSIWEGHGIMEPEGTELPLNHQMPVDPAEATNPPSEREEADPKANPNIPPPIPRGFYLHGAVGTGKSIIMHAFYDNSGVTRKVRMHMHEFLADIHRRLHRLVHPCNPKVIAVAREYAREYSLLYIDEFQLVDVADAVLVQHILAELLRLGTVLVATSNRSPAGLMEAGQFHVQPVVDLLQKFCIVHEIQSTIDYRQHMHNPGGDCVVQALGIPNTFFVTDLENNEDCKSEVTHVLQQIIGRTTESVLEDVQLASSQRTLSIQVYRRKDKGQEIVIGECSFSHLSHNMGVADYRELARQLDIVVLYDIPFFSDGTTAEADETRRFINLVDQLYEWRRPIVCTAPAKPNELFTSSRTQPGSPDRPGVDDIRFAYPRTASRLLEMTSSKWWKLVYDYVG